MAQYLKPDTELGYIEDQAEIESLKINNLRHTILGCMLGDFDETGAYVVDPEIVQELIEMPKYIVETMDNIEICKSILKLDKQISFMVTFEGNKATLSLIEKLSYEANYAMDSGTYSNINEYVLDTVETSGEVNRNVVYARWNIGDFSGDVVDIFNCDEEILEKYFGIINRFKYLLLANKILLQKEEAVEEVETEYTAEIFEILKRYPKFQEAVMKYVNIALTEKKDAITEYKPFYAKTLNEVLENAIVSNINILDEKQKEEFLIDKRNAIVNLNVKRAAILEMENIDIDNVQEADLSPRAIRLKANESYISKSVTELGEGFSQEHKKIINRKQEMQKRNQEGAVVSTGAATAIKAASKSAGATNAVAKKPNAVKPVVKKPMAKKPAVAKSKSAAKKAGGGQKSAGKASHGTEHKTTKPDETNEQTKPKKPGKRLVPAMAASVNTAKEPKNNKERKVAQRYPLEEMLKMEAEMTVIDKQENSATILAGMVSRGVVVGQEIKTSTVQDNKVISETKVIYKKEVITEDLSL